MLLFACFLGIASYTIFFLGLFHLLMPQYVIPLVVFLFAVFLYIEKRKFLSLKLKFWTYVDKILFALILLYCIVTLVGVLGPEIGFDALWYHLTIPKIFILQRSIFFVPGNLLYYSTFPKLVEMLYILPLFYQFETGAKLIHFLFFILCLLVIYKLARLYVNRSLSLLVVLVFLGNLVVGWEAITAYIDLARTSFEALSLFYLIRYFQGKRNIFFVYSAILMGFALSTKINTFSSLFISVFLILLYNNRKLTGKIISAFVYFCIPVVIASPYFLFAAITTRNPFYPLFSGILHDYGTNYGSVYQSFRDVFELFIHSPDPINPIYIITVPLVLFFVKKYSRDEKILVVYGILSIVLWGVLPRTGNSRFFIPYLPALSVLSIILITKLRGAVKRYLYVLVVFLFVISLGYRILANAKFIPVILGVETKQEFLMSHLNFNYGDFYDENRDIQKVVGNNKVLLVGLHNLYYVDFPFEDVTWTHHNDTFSYVLIQGTSLPSSFKGFRMVYSNMRTHVFLYNGRATKW